MKVLLIIPAYNEEENIERTIHSINEYQHQNDILDFSLDYVVINDGSIDRTKEILAEKNINHVNLIMNLGIGGAVQTGYKYAVEHDYDIAIQFDGDGQHDINSLETILRPVLEDETDFCIGSRFVNPSSSSFQTTAMRRTGIKILSFLIKLVTGMKVYDVTSGYRVANRKIIQQFADRYPVNYPEPESIVHLLKRKFRVKELPVNMKERIGGTSSIHSFKSVLFMCEVASAILISSFLKEKD